MKDIQIFDLTFVKDESGPSAERTSEVRKLIAQMMELARKRGRPSKVENEVQDAA